MKVKRVTLYPLNELWCVLTEFEDRVEHMKFASRINAIWHMETMLKRM